MSDRGRRFRDGLSVAFGRRIVGALFMLGVFVLVGELGRVVLS